MTNGLDASSVPMESGWQRLRARLPVILGVLVSGALLVLAMRNVRLGDVLRTLSGVRLVWLGPMIAILLGDLLVRSLRWRLLLSIAAPQARLWDIIEMETIGLAINNVLFLRLGEIVRGGLAGRQLRVPALTVFATILVERMLDLMSLLFLFAVVARRYPALVEPRLGLLAFLGASTAVTGLTLLTFADPFIQRESWQRRMERFPKTGRLLRQAAMGTRALRFWSKATAIVALGFALWIMDAGLYWTGARAVRMIPMLGYGKSVLVLASAAASSFLPAVPGSFGTFEQALMLLLVHLGVAEATALGFAGLIHILSYILVTGLGIGFLYRAGHTLASLKALGRNMQSPSAVP